ncbi:MAG: acyl-CoA synthetase [Ilumatobacteraceae bacterium]|nr:acyl-CoA synthetase [Ilumatobacteraceae bacterium]
MATHRRNTNRKERITTMSEQGWTFAELWETAAAQLPDAPFAKQGSKTVTWAEAERRAEGTARYLLDQGAQKQDKVAQYLYNSIEYLETFFACYKASLVPVNTNYRYAADELVYLWDNADAVAVIFHGTFVDTIEEIKDRVPKVKTWLWVDDGSGPCPDWAVPYEDTVDTPGEPVADRVERSGDDLYMLYTGGTTGMPKGVMWRQDDLIVVLGAGLGLSVPDEYDPDFAAAGLTQPGPVGMPACPLMHGTGSLTSFGTLNSGGCIVVLESRHFDAAELLDTIDRDKVNAIAIVGDAFAKPILTALDAEPDRWGLDSVLAFVSSGVMWSEETKQGMLGHQPKMMLMDAFSSSEALGMGTSVSGGGTTAKTARFEASENTIVVDDEGNRVLPGSSSIGRLAVGGRQPIGYYKDPEKSDRTFIMVDGNRYSCPGDYATIDADGTVNVLGRGSVCINSGGEKIFPEEVEEALKTHPAIIDAVVVGVPHERFGETVVGVVQAAPGTDLVEQEIIDHVRGRLAAYKAPRQIVEVNTIGRAANGKVDYKRLREHAVDRQ